MEILINNNTDFLIDEKRYELIEKSIKTGLSYLGYGLDYEISISIVDKDEIKALNKTYRDKDSVTDVLSFPLFERDNILDSGMLGDIVICQEKIKEQAKEYNHSETREFIYLLIHSLLHLLGYDHIDEEEKKIMRLKEKEIMAKLGIFK